jgi:hypothetical protein
MTGQANKIGYFYRPSDDFVVNEPGVWRARVRVWHDGATGVDTITFSFLLSGTDAGGTRRHFARQIVLQGEEILLRDADARRRSVRH